MSVNDKMKEALKKEENRLNEIKKAVEQQLASLKVTTFTRTMTYFLSSLESSCV